jgi:hypothetical protein
MLACALSCEGGAGRDGGAAHRDATPAEGSLPFDVSPRPDLPWQHPDAGAGCDGLSATGQCEDGGGLRWCEHGLAASADCTALGMGCGLHPDLDDGAWCLASIGQSCGTWPCRPELRCEPGLRCAADDAGAGED